MSSTNMESLDHTVSLLEKQKDATPKLVEELTAAYQQAAAMHMSAATEPDAANATEAAESTNPSSSAASYNPAFGRLRQQATHELEHPSSQPSSTSSTDQQQFTPPPKKLTPLILFERIILKLIDVLSTLQRPTGLTDLLHTTRAHFGKMPKAKTAKIVRLVVDALGKIPGSETQQIDTCREYIAWCITEKRTFLRLRIESRLASLLLARGENAQALELLKDLQLEIKKIDDKPLLVEIFLLESRAHLAHRNFPRAKASLTAARSSANAIYVAPLLQAEIDLQGGMLNAHDKDFRTAYSYFYEAFENLSTLSEPAMAQKCLKYMLLSKIMMGQTEELPTILNAKAALPYSSSRDVDAMRAMAKAYKERSLEGLEHAMREYPELSQDPVLLHHLSDLQTTLLETNLQRILEPYSHVEVSHVAKLIRLPVDQVEAKLSQMILDKKFNGILDQGSGLLIVYDHVDTDASYGAGMEVIGKMSVVVDSLFKRAVC